MSIKVVGKLTLENVPVVGKPAIIEDVPVGTTGSPNRDTRAPVIMKYLKEGFKWSLYNHIVVAKMVNEGGKYRLLDGDHRRHMYKLAFPNSPVIPARVVEVETKEEYHKLFQELNKDKRKTMTPEEAFVHKVLEGQPAAIKIADQLDACGLKIHSSSDALGEVGDIKSPTIKLGGFKKAIKISPLGTRWSAKMIKHNWPTDEKVSVELLGGITLLFTMYPVLDSKRSSVPSDFLRWWESHQNYTQGGRATHFKVKGGSVHAKPEASIAKGILKDYLSWCGTVPQATKKRSLPIKKVEVAFGHTGADRKEMTTLFRAQKAIALISDMKDIDW